MMPSFGTVGVCDPWPLVMDDSDGDGLADTARVAGALMPAGELATCVTEAQEVVLTVYQPDVRSASTTTTTTPAAAAAAASW